MTGATPPPTAPGFRWVDADWGVMLRADALARFPHGWTTRALELAQTAPEGWSAVAAAAGVGTGRLVRLRQVHRAGVYHAAGALPGAPPEADIAVTSDPSLALAVQVADCVPLLLADSAAGAVAAAHAGWRGTAADVAGTAVRALLDVMGSDPGSGVAPPFTGPDPCTVAAIGPSIGPCCYRVGEEVRDAFGARWPREHGAWFTARDGGLFLDLWAANRDQLIAAGVDPARVFVSGLCTACHPAWFPSYRRDGPGAGRIAGCIGASRMSA